MTISSLVGMDSSTYKLIREGIDASRVRAEAISKDTGLPIIYREDLKNELGNKILSSFETKINLPNEKIDLWKQQFK